jgi:hypothetical protein
MRERAKSAVAFSKVSEFESIFIEPVLKYNCKYLMIYKIKKCENHKRSYKKY